MRSAPIRLVASPRNHWRRNQKDRALSAIPSRQFVTSCLEREGEREGVRERKRGGGERESGRERERGRKGGRGRVCVVQSSQKLSV